MSTDRVVAEDRKIPAAIICVGIVFYITGCTDPNLENPVTIQSQVEVDCSSEALSTYLQAYCQEQHPDARELLLRIDAEQSLMAEMMQPSFSERGDARETKVQVLERMQSDNAQWLRNLNDASAFLDSSRYGDEVSTAAWLIIQHADHDPDWQAQMLETVEELFENGRISAEFYALLFDRVAVNSGRPQRFGSQGSCGEDGEWNPHPVEDSTLVDELRSSVGLEPLSVYAQGFVCH